MKMNKVVIAALVAGGVVVATRAGGCLGSKDPDEKLGANVEELCEIARYGSGKPVEGVKRLGNFLADHGGEMAAQYVDTIALIERIADDDKHDDRARLAHKRFVVPLAACQRDWDRFADAVENNEEAAELVMHAMERLDRTLTIIGSGARGKVKLRTLPRQLFPF